MKFIYNEQEFFDAYECAECVIENLDGTVFDEMLDECYPEVEIFGHSYYPSRALSCVDPVLYRCAQSDYYSSLAENLAYDLDHTNAENTVYFYGEVIEVADDEDEETA